MFAFDTPILLESFPLNEYPNGVHPSAEDVAELVDIMDAFRFSLLTATPRTMYDIFWIQCTFDALNWGGLQEDESDEDVPPPPTAWIDFLEVGRERVGGATPAGFHMIMFEQKVLDQLAVQPLFMALQWERDRVRSGERSGVHLEQISKYMFLMVEGIRRICAAAKFEHGDEDDNAAAA